MIGAARSLMILRNSCFGSGGTKTAGVHVPEYSAVPYVVAKSYSLLYRYETEALSKMTGIDLIVPVLLLESKVIVEVNEIGLYAAVVEEMIGIATEDSAVQESVNKVDL
jgi:hypothetical protein